MDYSFQSYGVIRVLRRNYQITRVARNNKQSLSTAVLPALRQGWFKRLHRVFAEFTTNTEALTVKKTRLPSMALATEGDYFNVRSLALVMPFIRRAENAFATSEFG